MRVARLKLPESGSFQVPRVRSPGPSGPSTEGERAGGERIYMSGVPTGNPIRGMRIHNELQGCWGDTTYIWVSWFPLGLTVLRCHIRFSRGFSFPPGPSRGRRCPGSGGHAMPSLTVQVDEGVCVSTSTSGVRPVCCRRRTRSWGCREEKRVHIPDRRRIS